jgi:uncharacterized tellurite resistance protein B-like protein
MTPLENLHYAIGQLAYAIARVDGMVHPEERKKFHDIVEAEVRGEDYAFRVSNIIFQLIDKDKQDSRTAYDWAMRQVRMNSHYLSPALKSKFLRVMEKIAEAYPPVTLEEREMIDNFKAEIAILHGDPVYYKT